MLSLFDELAMVDDDVDVVEAAELHQRGNALRMKSLEVLKEIIEMVC